MSSAWGRSDDPGNAPHSFAHRRATRACRRVGQRLRSMLRALLFPVAWLALQTQLLLLGLISVTWNLAALALYPLLPRATGLRLGRAMISFGYRQFWRVAAFSGMIRLHSDALDVLRDEARLIVVANHPSMLDALMLVARLPRSACVMKASLMRNPFLWPGARLARYIRNDSPHGMVRLAVEDLAQGGQLVLFPEGTRTTRRPVNAFRPGFTLIAKLAQAPIQAVFIDTDSPYLAKGWPLWRLPPLPIVFTVRLGRRFAPQDDHAALFAEVEGYFASGVQAPQGPAA
jgi:1-acyl-sn-glycerol-3-phosphate acyltransferase